MFLFSVFNKLAVYNWSHVCVTRKLKPYKLERTYVRFLSYLRNNRESWTQILESDLSDINTINNNSSTSSLKDAKQRWGKRWLASSCATDNSNLLSTKTTVTVYIKVRSSIQSKVHAYNIINANVALKN